MHYQDWLHQLHLQLFQQLPVLTQGLVCGSPMGVEGSQKAREGLQTEDGGLLEVGTWSPSQRPLEPQEPQEPLVV